MNETMNTILTRRSTRKFLNRPIPEEELQQIIQAALHAPSGMGRQTWQFTAVKNRGKIQELAAVIRKVLDRDGYDMYQPEVIIIPMTVKALLDVRMMPAPWRTCSWQPIPWESALCGLTSFRASVMNPPCARSLHPLAFLRTMWYMDWPHWVMRMM